MWKKKHRHILYALATDLNYGHCEPCNLISSAKNLGEIYITHAKLFAHRHRQKLGQGFYYFFAS